MNNLNKHEVDFNSMDHEDAVYHLIRKLEAKQPLTFAEQCAMFMITLAQYPEIMSKEQVSTIVGNIELWGEIQPLISEVANSFPTQKDIFSADCFNLAFYGDKPNKPSEYGNTQTYIIRKIGTNEIKIGKSIRVRERVRELGHQSGSKLEILAIIPKNIEHNLHKKFAEFRTVGEWFDDSKGLILEFSKQVKNVG